MQEPTPEFLCLECGRKDLADAFGAFIRCPSCSSADVLNYRLWKKYGAKTPPPRQGGLTLADFPRLLNEEPSDTDEAENHPIAFPPDCSAG